jgi:hypothetical protein
MADEVKIIRIVVDSSKAIDGSAAATRALKNIEESTGSMASALSKMESTLSGAATAIKAHLVIAVTELAAKMIEMAKASLEAASGLGEMAEQMGISARGLQALQFAAVQGGTKIEELQTGISKFSQKIGEATNGNKDVIDSFDRLGVKILDVHGNLIPTEALLGRVAKAITNIEDPAKRTAAQVDMFGKAGSKMAATLADISKGVDQLGTDAERAGAMISDSGIARLDAYFDSAARKMLVYRAYFADLAVKVFEALDRVDKYLSDNADAINKWLRGVGDDFVDLGATIGDWMRTTVASGARFAAEFLESIATLPGAIGNIFLQGMDNAIAAVEGGLNRMKSGMADSWLGRQVGMDGSPVSIPRVGGTSNADYRANRGQQIATAGQAAYNSVLGGSLPYGQIVADQRAAAAYQQLMNGQAGAFIGGIDTLAGGGGDTAPRGAGNPLAKGGGGGNSPEDRYKKLEQQLLNTSAAQEKMTAAAMAGDQAFNDAKVTVDAQNKLLEIFGQQLDANDPRLTRIKGLLEGIARGQASEAFAKSTNDLKAQNDVLEAEIRLLDAAPDARARELAVIKATQQAKKDGIDLDSQAYQDRVAAIDQNERLKSQQQELTKAQEMWTEPLKQALRDIQTAGANAFETMLDSGKFSFQSLGETFSKIIKRMAAEFLALATIRPVMSVLVNAVGATGLLPQSAISSMGYGGQLSPTGGGGLSGLGGSWGTSGGSGMLGGIGDWLNTPLTGAYAGMSPSSMAGVPMLSPSLMSPSTWGITPMMGLGAAAGIGGGIYQLLSGGGSTASTIGGISSMIGGAVSLIPGIGQIAGPAIALLGNILPGLFGGNKEPTITNQAYGQLSYGSGGFGTSGGAWGPTANASGVQGQLGQAGNSIQGIFDTLGGVQDASKVWGVALQSFSQSYGKNGSFSNQTSFLVDPSGNKTQWGQGSTTQDVGLDAASAQVAIRSIIGGAVGEISDSLRTALGTVGNRTGGGSLAEVGQAVTFVKAYDALGKSVTDAQKALDAITASFSDMKNGATALGLSLDPINTELEKQRQAYATGFADSLGRELDPTAYAFKDLDAWRTKMKEENQYILDNVTGALDQINNIEAVYGQRRAQIVAQAAQGSVSALEDIVKRLTYGDLSGASPSSVFSGTAGTYTALLAKAKAGDQSALAQISGAATDYAQAARAMYASSSDYENIRSGIVTDLSGLALANGGNVGDFNGQATSTISQQISFLTAAIQTQANDNATLNEKLTEAIALWQRMVNGN